MRTTVDIPDSLLARVKTHTSREKMTFRTLVISALEKALEDNDEAFSLEDASVGKTEGGIVSSEEVNRQIDEQRSVSFQP